MTRVTRSSTRHAATLAAASPAGSNQGASSVKREPVFSPVKRGKTSPQPPSKRVKTEPERSPSPKASAPIKSESLDDSLVKTIAPSVSVPLPDALRDKKLKLYAQHATKSPFPDFPRPTPDEARLAHRILASLHGSRLRPEEVAAPTSRAGCGDSPSVLDALVRTVLSQNTSDANSTRAKRSMDETYGGSDNWEAIAAGGTAKLEEAIRCGGLSTTKSRVIMNILSQAKERYGRYSLDHLFEASNEEAMQELIGLKGVGPKTASCVLLFCLRRETFAVDTHVWRITGLLGWRPEKATRDETHAHLDARIPDEEKYGLHVLLVTHGRLCQECKAGGKNTGKCELRKAFRKGGKVITQKTSV